MALLAELEDFLRRSGFHAKDAQAAALAAQLALQQKREVGWGDPEGVRGYAKDDDGMLGKVRFDWGFHFGVTIFFQLLVYF